MLFVDSFILNGSWTTETWALLASGWAELNTNQPPSFGTQSGAFYLVNDPADGYVLYLGGGTYGSNPGNETWTFVNRTWTQLHPSASPPPQDSSLNKYGSIAYDTTDGYVVLFTGNSTWTFSGGTWSKLIPNGQPPVPTNGDPMADDPACACVVLAQQGANKTWEFRGGSWTEVFPAYLGPILGPEDPEMMFDSYYGVVLLMNYSGQLWSFYDGNWTEIESKIPGAPGVSFGTFDSATAGVVVYWDYNTSQGHGQPLNQTWTFGSGEVSISSSPTNAGKLTMNSSVSTTSTFGSQTTDTTFGNYTASARAEPWARFAKWVVNGNLSFHPGSSNSSSASGSVVVMGNGSVTAVFQPAPFVYLFADPVLCGPITFGGQSYSSGSDPEFTQGTYSVSATCSDYRFYRWEHSANVSVSNPTASATSVNLVGGNGTLEAFFALNVTLSVSHVDLGSVFLNGTRFPDGATWTLPVGNYSLRAVPDAWGVFTDWTISGVGLQTSNGSVWVRGPGDTTLIAHFSLFPTVSVSIGLPRTADTSCLAFELDNSSQGSVTSLHLTLGTHRIIAKSECLYGTLGLFSRWQTSTNITVSSPSNSSSLMLVRGNATLIATYTTAYWVGFDAHGSSGGTIKLNGTPVALGSQLLLSNGTYAVRANAASGFKLIGWNTSGSVRVQNGSLMVGGTGTVTAEFVKVSPPGGNSTPAPSPFPLAIFAGIGVAVAIIAVTVIVFLKRRARNESTEQRTRSAARKGR